jgi:hypothetical protein
MQVVEDHCIAPHLLRGLQEEAAGQVLGLAAGRQDQLTALHADIGVAVREDMRRAAIPGQGREFRPGGPAPQ